MEQIDVTPDPPSGPIDVAPPVPTTPAPPITIAEQRASRADIGLPGFPLNKDQILQHISTGNEPAVRQFATSFVDEQKERYKQHIINNFMVAKGTSQLNPEEWNAVNELARQTVNSDPKNVFEENYPIEYFEKLKLEANVNPDSDWSKLDPKQKEEVLTKGRNWMTRQQILRRMYDDAQINAQNQGWPGYIADRAKEWLIPGYWQLKLRGHLPTNLLGEDLEKDMNYGFSLPNNSQFEEWAGKRTFQLEKDNPAMAVEWIGAMMGMSNREKDINNLLTATDFIGKPLGTGVAIGAVKSFLPRDLAKMALKATFREPVSRAAVEEGVGNIGKAASSDVAQQILDNTKGKGNPVGSIMRNLPGAFNTSIDNIRNNPGRLRREGVERILQNLEEARDRIVGDAVRMQNVDKVPILSALETKTDEFLKEIADRFPEIHNNLLNNSIRFDPLVNGYWADFYLGKTGIDLFSSQREAEKFIKANKLLDATTDPDYAHRSIIISKPMPSEWVKDILLNTEETKTPLNWLNSLYNGFIGKIRTPEETSSAAEKSAKRSEERRVGKECRSRWSPY